MAEDGAAHEGHGGHSALQRLAELGDHDQLGGPMPGLELGGPLNVLSKQLRGLQQHHQQHSGAAGGTSTPTRGRGRGDASSDDDDRGGMDNDEETDDGNDRKRKGGSGTPGQGRAK